MSNKHKCARYIAIWIMAMLKKLKGLMLGHWQTFRTNRKFLANLMCNLSEGLDPCFNYACLQKFEELKRLVLNDLYSCQYTCCGTNSEADLSRLMA